MSERERARRAAQRIASRVSLDVSGFCTKHGICRDRFYKEIRLGRLRARKVGRRTIITPNDEDAWLDSLPVLELAAGAA